MNNNGCKNCKYFIKLYKYPLNNQPYNGDITEETGIYCCSAYSNYESGTGIVLDRMFESDCEMFEEK